MSVFVIDDLLVLDFVQVSEVLVDRLYRALLSYDVCRLLGDHHLGGVGVATGRCWYNGGIGDSQSLDAFHSAAVLIDWCFTARQHKIGQFMPIYQGGLMAQAFEDSQRGTYKKHTVACDTMQQYHHHHHHTHRVHRVTSPIWKNISDQSACVVSPQGRINKRLSGWRSGI